MSDGFNGVYNIYHNNNNNNQYENNSVKKLKYVNNKSSSQNEIQNYLFLFLNNDPILTQNLTSSLYFIFPLLCKLSDVVI